MESLIGVHVSQFLRFTHNSIDLDEFAAQHFKIDGWTEGRTDGRVDGWVTFCVTFTSRSDVFQSYRDSGRMIVAGYVQ